MATREENLKKINDQLEQLSDEDLDNVAGGSVGQTADDSQILYKYGLVSDWHRFTGTLFKWKSVSSEVDSGWAKAGITCVTKPMSDNQYFLNGKEITRAEAIAHVENNFKQVNNI